MSFPGSSNFGLSLSFPGSSDLNKNDLITFKGVDNLLLKGDISISEVEFESVCDDMVVCCCWWRLFLEHLIKKPRQSERPKNKPRPTPMPMYTESFIEDDLGVVVDVDVDCNPAGCTVGDGPDEVAIELVNVEGEDTIGVVELEALEVVVITIALSVILKPSVAATSRPEES